MSNFENNNTAYNKGLILEKEACKLFQSQAINYHYEEGSKEHYDFSVYCKDFYRLFNVMEDGIVKIDSKPLHAPYRNESFNTVFIETCQDINKGTKGWLFYEKHPDYYVFISIDYDKNVTTFIFVKHDELKFIVESGVGIDRKVYDKKFNRYSLCRVVPLYALNYHYINKIDLDFQYHYDKGVYSPDFVHDNKLTCHFMDYKNYNTNPGTIEIDKKYFQGVNPNYVFSI